MEVLAGLDDVVARVLDGCEEGLGEVFVSVDIAVVTVEVLVELVILGVIAGGFVVTVVSDVGFVVTVVSDVGFVVTLVSEVGFIITLVSDVAFVVTPVLPVAVTDRKLLLFASLITPLVVLTLCLVLV